MTDPNHPSIAVQKKIATNTAGLGMVASAAPCKISIETNREGVVILDGGLVPYKKGGLILFHMQQNTDPIILISFLA